MAEKLCKEVKKGVAPGKTAKFIWAQLRGVSDFFEGQVGAERQQAAADRARAEIRAEASVANKLGGDDFIVVAFRCRST